jgi:hypothetical protein
LELAADVEHWLADEPVAAWPESVFTRFLRWSRRHPLWIAYLIFIGVVDLVVVPTFIGIESLAWMRVSAAGLIFDVAVFAQLGALLGALVGTFVGFCKGLARGDVSRRCAGGLLRGVQLGCMVGGLFGVLWLLIFETLNVAGFFKQ